MGNVTLNRRLTKFLLLMPAVVLLGLFFIAPNFDVIRASFFDPDFTLEHFHRIVDRAIYFRVFNNTIQISLVVSILCVLIGYPIAYYITQQDRKKQFRLLLLIFIPLWMSVLIRSYSWMIVLGRDGVINQIFSYISLLDSPIKLLYTSGAVYVAMIQVLLPIQIVACYSAMTQIDTDLIRAARICGARPLEALRKVYLPLSMDGTLTGMVIVFMLSMGFFITPALVGGRKDLMLGNLIMQNIHQLNWGFAAAIAVAMLGITIVLVIVLRSLGRAFSKALV